MINVMKIRYAEATLTQLARAKAQNPGHYAPFQGNNYEEILEHLSQKEGRHFPYKDQKDIYTAYPSYTKNGKLTLVGKAKRETDLERIGLPPTATVGEYLKKQWENTQETVKKVYQDWLNLGK